MVVSNDGDLPAYVTDIKVSIAGEEETSPLFAVIPADETTTLKGEFFIGPIKEGSYRATYELLETHLGEPSVTLATHSATVQVPQK